MTAPLSISQITFAIKERLELEFNNLWVEGEVSNFKEQSSGHWYFTLKDAGAQMPCVVFKFDALKSPRIKDGDKIALKGSISVYPPHGKYQMIGKEVRQSGLGALLLQFQALKEKLSKLGWFDLERKKPLPKFPKTIGVITSPTGAVIQDILHVLERRAKTFHLILYPVKVQGEGAKEEISEAIQFFNTHQLADLLIVARGGGSLEDLWPFNEEMVAQAILNSSIPIISAVGHETDVTIADLVADVRAPTPSAAAELAMPEKWQLFQKLQEVQSRLISSLQWRLQSARHKLERFSKHPLFTSPHHLLSPYLQKIDILSDRIDEQMLKNLDKKKLKLQIWEKQLRTLAPQNLLKEMEKKLAKLSTSLDISIKRSFDDKLKRLIKTNQHLQSLNPKNVLKRGYSILLAENETSVIMSHQELLPGRKITALLSDGSAPLQVLDSDGKNP